MSAVLTPVPSTFDRRIQRMQRTFLTLIQASVERGDLTVDSAAELALYYGVTMRVVRDMLTRAQGRHAPDEWPELCASVAVPRFQPDPFISDYIKGVTK